MLTVQIEDVTPAIIEEMRPLFPEHYDELAEHKIAGIPLDPQYEIYLARAQMGQTLLVTLREAGKLVGYLVSFVAPGLHYRSCLTATGDIFFVYPDKRGLAGGVMLFEGWIKECQRRGVDLAQIGLKSRHVKYARPLLEAIGFVETEIMFWKFLEKASRPDMEGKP